MPLTDDQKAIAYASLVPGASALISYVALGGCDDVLSWWKGLKKPTCNVSAENELAFQGILTALASAPILYATYKVWKEAAFDYNNTTKALASFALLNAACIPNGVAKKKRCLKSVFLTGAAMFGASCLTSFTYYEVKKELGYLALPMTALQLYYTIYLYQVWKLNEKTE